MDLIEKYNKQGIDLLFIDFETYSEVDIKTHGHYRYTRNCDINLCGYAFNNGLISVSESNALPGIIKEAFDNDKVAIVAHNSTFEREVIRSAWGYRLPHNRFICTASLARSRGLPGSLDMACFALGLKGKNYEGKASMLDFAKPNKKGVRLRKEDNPEKWAKMVSYCGQDVEIMRELFLWLPFMQKEERKLWVIDQEINDRGIPFDRELVEKICVWGVAEKEAQEKECQEICGLNPTQREAILKWLQENQRVKIQDLTADSVSQALKNPFLNREAKRVLEIRQSASKSSISKYQTMLDYAIGNRINGQLLYHGAGTGRWSGRGIQPHNLPRGVQDPSVRADELAETLSHIDKLEDIGLFYEHSPAELLSTAIRGCIKAPKGDVFLVADFTGIEARVLGWMAGEESYQKAFRDKLDLYKVQAAGIYGVPYEEVTKDQRQMGKQAVLGLGYGMGAPKFVESCAKVGVKVSDAEAFGVVKKFRESAKAIPNFWYGLEKAVRSVIEGKKKNAHCGKCEVTLGPITPKGDRPLIIVLPSGRPLYYHHPKIEGREITYHTSQQGQWVESKLYGGLLVENVVQATARDLLRESILNVNANVAFRIVLHVHDEVVAVVDEGLAEELYPVFCDLMASPPIWATGCYYGVDGFISKRYKK